MGGTANIECELKLAVAPADLPLLASQPILAGPGGHWHLLARYYDTPDLALRRAGVGLRVRREGPPGGSARWVQTVKTVGHQEQGVFRRQELDQPLAGEELEPDLLPREGDWETLFTVALVAALEPVLVTDVRRESRRIRFQGSQVEVALDRGEIRAGPRRRELAEVELELLSGEPIALVALADTLGRVVPMTVETRNKAELGYELLDP